MGADLFDVLVATTLAGSLAIFGVLATRVLIRRWFGSQAAYAVWIVVPLVALAMLLPAPLRPIAMQLHFTPTAAAHAVAAMAVPAAADWRPTVVLLWLLGALATLVRFALQQRRYLRSLGRLRAFRNDKTARVVRAEAIEGCPALIGAWRPRIVLPADFDVRYAPRERALIFAHEHVHLARGDAGINALVAALRCLNWFNPLLHHAASRFRFDQELACDATVITRFPEGRRSYADAMLKTQLAGQSRQEMRLPVGCRWPSCHPLKERIIMLKQPLPTHTRRTLGVVLVALLGFGGAYVAWAANAPSPLPLPVAAAEGSVVDAQIRLSVGGAPMTSMRMVNPVGQPFAASGGSGAQSWHAQFVARPVAGGGIELQGTIHRGDALVAEPIIVVKPLEPGSIVIGDPGKPEQLRLEAILALHAAGWKPPAIADHGDVKAAPAAH